MRWIRRILVFLLVLLLGLGVTGIYFVQRAFPQTDGEIRVGGLSESVRVVRDIDGVPHIYAANTHDLYFAQGYVHAQDRFWQMDFWRHIGSGRLSEMFGESQLETDEFLRALGFSDLANQELETMDPNHLAVLQDYSDGVNAFLNTHSPTQVSFEYALLPLQVRGYRIEPWKPANTLTWAKVMAWDLSGNLEDEVQRAVLSKTLPVDRIEQLYPDYPDRNPVIVPEATTTASTAEPGVVPDGALEALASAGEAADGLWAVTGGGFEGIGSNNWVIGGDLTDTGMPILANDPHLAIQMPSIWYEIGLHCDGSDCPDDVAGFGFAGVPGIVVGHNEHIAWGVTTEALDTQDLYIERLDPEHPNEYEVDGEWVPMETRTEVIEVGGSDPVSYEVQTTRHGPIISGIYLDDGELNGASAPALPDDYAVSMAWQALEPSTLIAAVIDLNRATDYDDFVAAASKWDIAAQNLVYADVEGNIAYQSTGEAPIRGAGDGRYPSPGWDTSYDWIGLVPFEDMPRLFNPDRGYVASANQPVTRAGTGPFEGYDLAYGYRAARIETMIQATNDHSVESVQRMQTDAEDGGALNLVPALLDIDTGDEAVSSMQDLLRSWSAGGSKVGGESPGAAAYQATWRNVLDLTFGDELPEDLRPEGGSRWFEVVRDLLEQPDDPFWDDIGTESVETRDDVLEQAMASANAELVDLLGPDPDNWEWGKLHRATFRNQSFGESGIAPIEWLFNRTAPDRVGGTDSVVDAVGWSPVDGYEVDWLPSFRMVIDLSDLSKSTAIHTTGQSGHVYAGHYDDMVVPWTDGAQHPMRWTPDQVSAATEDTLTLDPVAP
jgi:penicillin G amidase